MERIRVIPTLLLKSDGLVKTVKFKNPKYVGDPVNTVKIFNEKEVDEIVVLDIQASREGRGPRMEKIAEIAGECFMPMGYGGGISTVQQMHDILISGAEKVIVNSAVWSAARLLDEAAQVFGSQSIVVSIDAKKKFLGGYSVMSHGGTRKTGMDPVQAAKLAVDRGAGEIFVNSIDRDGTYTGYDIALIRSVAQAVSVPVIACGGASSVKDFTMAISEGKASAVAAGSMFVYHGPHKAVLVNFPDEQTLTKQFFEECDRSQSF